MPRPCRCQEQFYAETQGEAPSATFLNKGEFVVGGTDEDISGFATMAINDELIMMVQDRKGRARLIGCEAFAPKITVSQASGSGVTMLAPQPSTPRRQTSALHRSILARSRQSPETSAVPMALYGRRHKRSFAQFFA